MICGAENKLIHIICLILVSTELLPASYGSLLLLPSTPSDCGINKASKELLGNSANYLFNSWSIDRPSYSPVVNCMQVLATFLEVVFVHNAFVFIHVSCVCPC